MVVHSSMCNPWFYPFFGTLAMALCQIFGEELYTIMSNAGMLVFIITILLLMAEVDKDIVAINNEACFLVQVAQKGDHTRILDPSFLNEEEEKRPEDEETGLNGSTHNETTIPADQGVAGSYNNTRDDGEAENESEAT